MLTSRTTLTSSAWTRRGAVAALLLVTGACHAPNAGTPLTAEFGKDDPDSQMEFWHRLNERAMTSNDEAFHGLLLYVDNADPAADYAARVSTLKAKK